MTKGLKSRHRTGLQPLCPLEQFLVRPLLAFLQGWPLPLVVQVMLCLERVPLFSILLTDKPSSGAQGFMILGVVMVTWSPGATAF